MPRSPSVTRPRASTAVGEHDAELAERELAVVHQVEIVAEAVLRTVLHHRRDGDAVGRDDAAQGEWREQQW